MTDNQTPHVYSAIAAVMADMTKEGIGKDSMNEQQRYRFRGIDAVYNALAPKLATHGLCILPRVIAREMNERETRNGGVLFYTRLTVEFDLVSAKDGSKHTICTVGEAMDSGDKSSNKAMSAAYKYAAFMAFCIPTEGDNDADSSTHEVKAASYQPPVSKPNPMIASLDKQLDALSSELRTLRDTERKFITEPPPFAPDKKWQPEQLRAALEDQIIASRRRLYDWIASKVQGGPALEELDDQGLIDLAYAAAGL